MRISDWSSDVCSSDLNACCLLIGSVKLLPTRRTSPCAYSFNRWCLVTNPSYATRSSDVFTCYPMRVLGRQEHRQRCNVFGLAETAQRCASDQFFAKLTGEVTVSRWRVGVTRQNRVDPDTTRSKLSRQRERQRIDRALGG